MARSKLDKFLGVVPDGYSARPEGRWGKHKSAPTRREVMTGQRFADGGSVRGRDINTGKYTKEIVSPREARAMKAAADARGEKIIFIKDTGQVEATDGGNGCMVIFLVGGATLLEALYQVGKAILT